MLNLKNHCYLRRPSCLVSTTVYKGLASYVFDFCKAHIYGILRAVWPCYEQMHFCFNEEQNFEGRGCELSCLPMTAFDGSFTQGLRRKVYPVGSRAKKCIFVLLAYINVQSSFRWITITIRLWFCRSVRKLYWIIAWLSSLEMQRASATKRPRYYIVD